MMMSTGDASGRGAIPARAAAPLPSPDPAHDPSPGAAGQPRRASTGQILRAAEEVFARQGFGGATMAAIAEAANLPKANLHYYFGSKEQLYRAVLEDILSTWLHDSAVWIVPERSPREALTGYIRAKMALTRARGDASRLFAGELIAGGIHVRHFLENELCEHVARMQSVFAHWAKTGLMRPVSAVHLLFCIWAMTQSYADFGPQMQAVLRRPDGLRVADYEDGTDMILSLVLAGAGADSLG